MKRFNWGLIVALVLNMVVWVAIFVGVKRCDNVMGCSFNCISQPLVKERGYEVLSVLRNCTTHLLLSNPPQTVVRCYPLQNIYVQVVPRPVAETCACNQAEGNRVFLYS